MSKKYDQEEDSLPSPSRPNAPVNVNFNNEDDIGEETTRRAQHTPNLNPTMDPVGVDRSLPASTQPAFPSSKAAEPPSQRVTGAQIDTKRPSAPPSLWPLTDVPTLPQFYPLERTAVFVPNVPASEIASRVCNILRERSIDATYDIPRAKVKCVTPDNVDFRVRLYRGRNQWSHGIIVEVQRRFGFSVDFHNVTVTILDAAEGKPPRAAPPMEGLAYVSDSDDDYEPSQSISSLDFVSKMLEQPTPDSHNLALQTLSSLTDPTKMGRKTAQAVSRVFLEPGNDVGSKVVSLVKDEQVVDPDDIFHLHLMAMTVLSNAIQAVSGDVPKPLWADLRPMFVEILSSASTNPQMAYLSARSIELFLKDDRDAHEFYAPLEAALVVGQERHAALARQAESCLKILESRY